MSDHGIKQDQHAESSENCVRVESAAGQTPPLPQLPSLDDAQK